jgi:hypothetical protein
MNSPDNGSVALVTKTAVSTKLHKMRGEPVLCGCTSIKASSSRSTRVMGSGLPVLYQHHLTKKSGA